MNHLYAIIYETLRRASFLRIFRTLTGFNILLTERQGIKYQGCSRHTLYLQSGIARPERGKMQKHISIINRRDGGCPMLQNSFVFTDREFIL